jgi:hypothetical protein
MRANALLLSFVTGCSFAFVNAPPEHAASNADCTESQIAPAVDLLLGAGLVIAGIVGVTAKSGCDNTTQDCTASNLGGGVAHGIGAAALVSGAVFGMSSYRGFADTGACRALHRKTPAGPPPVWNPDQS